jgi:hypothetical protein
VPSLTQVKDVIGANHVRKTLKMSCQMNHMIVKYFTLFAFFLAINTVSAQSTSIQTHCTADEKKLLNANMQSVVHTKGKPNGKVLSLCADRDEPPFSRIVYRYGKIGVVELEHVATANSKMGFDRAFSLRPGGGTDEGNVLWFQRGSITYAITVCTRGCIGSLDLTVHKGEKLLARLTPHEEYFDVLTYIDFEIPSPVIVHKEMPSGILTWE